MPLYYVAVSTHLTTQGSRDVLASNDEFPVNEDVKLLSFVTSRAFTPVAAPSERLRHSPGGGETEILLIRPLWPARRGSIQGQLRKRGIKRNI